MKDKLPGKPELVSSEAELLALAALEKASYTYSVEDYFRKPKQSGFKFSPNGLYLSFREKDADGKSHVYLKNTETNAVSLVIKEGADLIRGYAWANDNEVNLCKGQWR